MGHMTMHPTSCVTKQKGSVIILFLISIITLLSMGALSIDLSHLYLVRGELQDVADAAALSGASALAVGTDEVRDRAHDYALYNSVEGQAFELADSDIECGIWDFIAGDFTPEDTNPNAVRVTSRKTADSPKGEAQLLLARLFGKQKAAVVAQAVAVVNSRDIVLVLDRSGSMGEEGGTKLQGVKDGANLFVDLLINQSLTEDKVGVVWYNNNAYLASHLTDNLAQLHAKINSATATGWTSISEGLLYGINELKSNYATPNNKKIIIILTDGRANTCVPLPETPGWLEPPGSKHSKPDGGCCDAPGNKDNVPWDPDPLKFSSNSRAKREVMYLTAEEAIPTGITIYTITLGDPSNVDGVLMQEVANKTNGLYFTTNDPDNIVNIFQDIAERIDISLVR